MHVPITSCWAYPSQVQRIILKETMSIFPGRSWCHLGPAMNANVTTFSRMRLMPIFSIASTGEAGESAPASSGHCVKHPSTSKQAGGRGWINLCTCFFHHQVPKNTAKKPPLVTKCGKCKIFLKKGCSLMFDLCIFQAWSKERTFYPWNRVANKC